MRDEKERLLLLQSCMYKSICTILGVARVGASSTRACSFTTMDARTLDSALQTFLCWGHRPGFVTVHTWCYKERRAIQTSV